MYNASLGATFNNLDPVGTTHVGGGVTPLVPHRSATDNIIDLA